MILWCDGPHDAAENMRRDAALLAAAESGSEPVLRLFAFRGPGITLGMAQDPARELDLPRCGRDGVGWAVRPTGGRAILHVEEWTYAFAAPRLHALGRGGLAETYGRASRWIVRSLIRLGVPAEFAAGRLTRDRPRGAERGAAAPCFASTARHEVVIAGRKLVGSAQRRTARAVLQQGSILLGSGHLRIVDYLRMRDEERAGARATLEHSTATAAPWLGETPPLERWADALMAELGPEARRVDGTAGGFLLTLPSIDSYTPARLP